MHELNQHSRMLPLILRNNRDDFGVESSTYTAQVFCFDSSFWNCNGFSVFTVARQLFGSVSGFWIVCIQNDRIITWWYHIKVIDVSADCGSSTA